MTKQKRVLLSDYGWRKINTNHWWAPDIGSATRTAEGWVASESGYEDVVLDPRVGPFRTAQKAMSAWMKERRGMKLSEFR